MAKWNVTPLIFEGGEDISLQHFIAPSFEFLLCLSVFLCLYSWFGWMFDSGMSVKSPGLSGISTKHCYAVVGNNIT